MPEVSVVVPNFNHAQFIEKRLETIFAQTFNDFEVIILDDCSTDDSRLILRAYENHPQVKHIIYNQINSGSSFRQWQKGIEYSSGNYLWIAESDDFSDTNFLQTGMNALQTQGIDLFYCKTVQVDKSGAYLRDLEWWLKDLSYSKWETTYAAYAEAEIVSFLIYKNFICNASSVLFKKSEFVYEFLNDVSGLKFCGDWLFWLKYFNKHNRIYYSTETTNYWRDHTSTTRSSINFDRNKEMLKVFEWVKKNGYAVSEYNILRYYFKYHLHKLPRTNILANLKATFEGMKYSRMFAAVMFEYYTSPKKFTS
jgi:glycosyltransferase involved in cell wall biosynthesis